MSESEDEKSKELVATSGSGGGSEKYDLLAAPTLEFDKLYSKAIELVNAQAMLDGADVKELSISEIELTKAKADSFIKAMANMVEIGHLAEMLKSQQLNFKRKDELEVLNDLRETCSMAAKISKNNMMQAANFQTSIYENNQYADDEKIKLIEAVEETLDKGINRSEKLISSMDKLIMLERNSGSRPVKKESDKAGLINYMMKLEDHAKEARKDREYGENTSTKEVKPMTAEELDLLTKKEKDEA